MVSIITIDIDRKFSHIEILTKAIKKWLKCDMISIQNSYELLNGGK